MMSETTSRFATWVVVLLAMMVLISAGCSKEETEEADQAAPTFDHRGQGLTETLDWGQYDDHPIQTALPECIFVDEEQLLFWHRLLVISDWDEGLASMAPAMGIDLDGDDEFAREEKLELVEDKIHDKFLDLYGQALCVEMDLYLDEYNFDAERLSIANRGHWKVYRDTLPERPYESADSPFSAGDPPPLPLKMMGLSDILTMPSSQAEDYLRTLETVERQPVEADEDDDQDVYFTEQPVTLLPPEAREAMTYSEVLALRRKGGQERDTVSVDAVERYMRPPEGTRRAPAVVVFGLRASEVSALGEIPVDGRDVQLPQLVGDVEQVMLLSADKTSVQAAWPEQSASHVGTDVEAEAADGEAHEAILDGLCDGSTKRFSEPHVVDGELDERVTWGCEGCPLNSSANTDLEVDFIARGSFSRAGAEEAIVHALGCTRRYGSSGKRGVTALLRREVSGQWRLIDYTEVDDSKCQFFDTGFGTALPFCEEINWGEDPMLLANYLLDTRPGEISSMHLAQVGSSPEGACGSTAASVEQQSLGIDTDREESPLFELELEVSTSRTADGSDRCFGEPELITNEEQLVIPMLVHRWGLEMTPEGEEAQQTLENIEW